MDAGDLRKYCSIRIPTEAGIVIALYILTVHRPPATSVKGLCSMVTLHNKQIGFQAPFLNEYDVQVRTLHQSNLAMENPTYIKAFAKHSCFIDQFPEGISQCNYESFLSTRNVGKATTIGSSLGSRTIGSGRSTPCNGRAPAGKVKHAATETATFFFLNFSYIFMFEAAPFWQSALIQSNGYVLLEPYKCLEPSLLRSTNTLSCVTYRRDSREQGGAPHRPSSLHSAGSGWWGWGKILQLTPLTLHCDLTQGSYNNPKLRPKRCLWSVLGDMMNTPGKYKSKYTPSMNIMNITHRQSLNCELPSDHFAANPSSGPHVFATTSAQKSRTRLKNCSCSKIGSAICKWGGQ